tara:strand:- start:233 stop:415 length:183 start_codon:yes stop_codon:yes gene_type:complete
LIRKSNFRHDAKIIDVGSGTSSLKQELNANNFVDITALDISKSALNNLNMRLGKNSKKIV